MAIKYGKTWWGEQWLGALKDIDYSNRLPRGASYARQGMVKEIQIDGNVISAKVQGSRIKPYSETIKLHKFTESEIDKLMDLITERPAVVGKLFNRQLDVELARLAERIGLRLFPHRWSDLDMNCSCPDWAVPCKHLAAVIYKTSMEIDNNPFLVFSLHGVDLIGELQKRGITSESEQAIEAENIDAVYGTEPLTLKTQDGHGIKPDFTTLQNLMQPLSDLLPASPPFCHNGDFKATYQKELKAVAKKADKILNEKDSLAPLSECLADRRRECGIDDLTDAHMLQKVLNIDDEDIINYSLSVQALRQLAVACLQLIAHGCIVPQIYKTETTVKRRGRAKPRVERKYQIVWHPAILDNDTAQLVPRLGQSENLLCYALTQLVAILSETPRPFRSDVFQEMFFEGLAYEFNAIGETEQPGGIRAWLERYFSKSRYQIRFVVNETEQGFDAEVQMDGVPLAEILSQEEYKPKRLDMLRQISILSDTVAALDDYINGQAVQPMQFTLAAFTPFLLQVVPAMRLLGVQVVLPKSLGTLIRPKASLRLTAKSTESEPSFLNINDLIDFNWCVALGDELLTPEEFGQWLGKAAGLMRFKQNYIYVDAADVVKLQKVLAASAAPKLGALLQAALSGEYEGAKVELTAELRALIKRFTETEAIPLPTGLHAQLRPYQECGFSWMYRNMRLGFGSIIADDMGLGKTLQVITLLLKLKEEGRLEGRKALVVVPTSLLYNWQEEIRRFSPTLSSAIYHGNARSLKSEACAAADVLLTTYGVVRSDADVLKKLHIQALVIDEAQNIKNSDTAQSKAIRSIHANAYIAMSGTPVENRLSEFWSIIDFTNKGYLGTLKDFSQRYARPIQREGDQNAAERFRKVTAPFLLRRLKTDKNIISDLPDKIETNEWAALTPAQAALYQETVNRCLAVIEGVEGNDPQTLLKRQGLVLQMILALKQICNHPTQYLKDGRMEAQLSGKTELLLDLLRTILNSGEKVLVFTQFREMGELLQTFIREALGETALFYHGGCSVKQRQDMVNRFQNEPTDRIFILSLKAAGTGLNLTAATHVIHYDLWWNPAVEAQATDRAYRIGQTANVQVHRFITKGTFEERIDDMIQNKRHLADITVSVGENWIGKLSNKELREIFL